MSRARNNFSPYGYRIIYKLICKALMLKAVEEDIQNSEIPVQGVKCGPRHSNFEDSKI